MTLSAVYSGVLISGDDNESQQRWTPMSLLRSTFLFIEAMSKSFGHVTTFFVKTKPLTTFPWGGQPKAIGQPATPQRPNQLGHLSHIPRGRLCSGDGRSFSTPGGDGIEDFFSTSLVKSALYQKLPCCKTMIFSSHVVLRLTGSVYLINWQNGLNTLGTAISGTATKGSAYRTTSSRYFKTRFPDSGTG